MTTNLTTPTPMSDGNPIALHPSPEFAPDVPARDATPPEGHLRLTYDRDAIKDELRTRALDAMASESAKQRLAGRFAALDEAAFDRDVENVCQVLAQHFHGCSFERCSENERHDLMAASIASVLAVRGKGR